MFEEIVNYVTLIAFITLTSDILFQVFHIVKRRSSADLSIKGCIIRMIAILALETKFILVGDFWLILGQGIFSLVFLFYLILIIAFRK